MEERKEYNTEEEFHYWWFPNTWENGGQFSREDIVNHAANFLNGGIPGIYFLLDCDEIVYVGQSKDIQRRMEQHSKAIKWVDGAPKMKKFNRFFVILCPEEELNRLEAYYILRFRPKYNIAMPKGGDL